MKCWKCGNEIAAGASKCLSCGADQNRSIPKSDIGKAMRRLYDRYGKDAVLGKMEYLDQGLADILNASGDIPSNALKLRRLIRTAMEAGLGKLYLDQLNGTGIPDKAFYLHVETLMTEDADLSEKAAKEIADYFDEMIGWRKTADYEEISRTVPIRKHEPQPEPALEPQQKKETKLNTNKTRSIVLIAFGAVVILILGLVIGNVLKRDKNQVTIHSDLRDTVRNASVGDYIKFGSYEQDNNISNGKEDIEWLVLAKEDNKALVISRYGLDSLRYNDFRGRKTWEDCTLRKRLNDTFIHNAFSTEEQDMIQNSTVTADNNPQYDTSPGNTVDDKIFLLSITEAEQYFRTDDSRKCVPTDYAIARGAWLNGGYDNSCRWWLRSPGINPTFAAYVFGGGVVSIGTDVTADHFVVRPALWINLGS